MTLGITWQLISNRISFAIVKVYIWQFKHMYMCIIWKTPTPRYTKTLKNAASLTEWCVDYRFIYNTIHTYVYVCRVTRLVEFSPFVRLFKNYVHKYLFSSKTWATFFLRGSVRPLPALVGATFSQKRLCQKYIAIYFEKSSGHTALHTYKFFFKFSWDSIVTRGCLQIGG
jgi:hypothetical protein